MCKQAGAAPMSNSIQITSSFGKGAETRCGCFNFPTLFFICFNIKKPTKKTLNFQFGRRPLVGLKVSCIPKFSIIAS